MILSCAHKKQELKSISILADIKYDPWGEECFIPKEWLIKKVPLQEMCNNYKKDVSWQRLKPLLLEGDEIWYFDSPRKYWHKFAGRRGYDRRGSDRVKCRQTSCLYSYKGIKESLECCF